MEALDPARFPRVDRYLSSLPDGLRSHPHCQAKASIARHLLNKRPLRHVERGALPEALRRLARDPPLENEWLPEVSVQALVLAIADDARMEDEAFLSWIGPVNRELFEGVYGLVLTLLSPALATRNATSYWKLFHRGSTLGAAQVGARHWEMRLDFPPGLFTGLALRQYAPVIEAGLQFADRTSRVALRESDEQHAVFDVTWGAG